MFKNIVIEISIITLLKTSKKAKKEITNLKISRITDKNESRYPEDNVLSGDSVL